MSKTVTKYDLLKVEDNKTMESLDGGKNKILERLKGLEECKDSKYNDEINGLEYRPGTNVPVTGGMYVPRYTQ
ncbi:hypothetical protein, partial [Escherichia coli]|uniref:hypothetical protein n=1 Tax=Escherichia coli TaxID=562 RepID=UPI0010CC0981